MNESDFPQAVDATSYKNPSTERTHQVVVEEAIDQ